MSETQGMGLSFVDCGVCGKEYLAPTRVVLEVERHRDPYYFVCHRCDVHTDYCRHVECLWQNTNVFCKSCEHNANDFGTDSKIVFCDSEGVDYSLEVDSE